MSRARDLADSADLNFDDGTLVIDSGNNRVGIGTASPAFGFEYANTDPILQIKDSNSTGSAANPYVRMVDSNGTLMGYMGFGSASDANFYLHQHSANPIQFNTNNSEAMRIDSSGNLLVGKTATGIGTAGIELRSNDQIYVTNNSVTILSNVTGGDADHIQFRRDGATQAVIGLRSTSDPYIAATEGLGTGIKFDGGNTSIVPCKETGASQDNYIDLGESGTRFKNLYLSGGVVFGDAGGSGTSTSNTLDDYEEGTWDPSVGGTATYDAARYGRYVKIGNVVTLQFRIKIATIGTGSTFRLSALPFTSENIGTVQSGHCSFYSGLAVSTIYLAFYVENNATTCQFVGKSSSGTTVDNGIGVFGNGADILGQITYRTA